MDREFETFSRGSKRLDYVFGTQELAKSIVRIGLTPYSFVVSSDHRGLFIDFNVDPFLGGYPSHLMSPAIRGIKSNSPKQCRIYVESDDEVFDRPQRQVFDRAIQAQTQTDTHGLTTQLARIWESIDRDFLRACLHAERIAKSRERPAWSPKLHHASMIVACWKTTLSSIRTERDATQQLERLF